MVYVEIYIRGLRTIKMDVSNVLIVIKGEASDWSPVTLERYFLREVLLDHYYL